ncbi:hypothetical protein CBR_g54636 [Chara braunii]|uniref:Uncharacterized protein n=1 Tax=Chara braunii TaxID=69332 RepID=A0A388MCA3_CHABU|nr:hypothetical protein CBR_g54636 [Chara braunii]|eukprot:GBG92191.1 hypothetical protein CBR_g54636 [Chara braunii]
MNDPPGLGVDSVPGISQLQAGTQPAATSSQRQTKGPEPLRRAILECTQQHPAGGGTSAEAVRTLQHYFAQPATTDLAYGVLLDHALVEKDRSLQVTFRCVGLLKKYLFRYLPGPSTLQRIDSICSNLLGEIQLSAEAAVSANNYGISPSTPPHYASLVSGELSSWAYPGDTRALSPAALGKSLMYVKAIVARHLPSNGIIRSSGVIAPSGTIPASGLIPQSGIVAPSGIIGPSGLIGPSGPLGASSGTGSNKVGGGKTSSAASAGGIGGVEWMRRLAASDKESARAMVMSLPGMKKIRSEDDAYVCADILRWRWTGTSNSKTLPWAPAPVMLGSGGMARPCPEPMRTLVDTGAAAMLFASSAGPGIGAVGENERDLLRGWDLTTLSDPPLVCLHIRTVAAAKRVKGGDPSLPWDSEAPGATLRRRSRPLFHYRCYSEQQPLKLSDAEMEEVLGAVCMEATAMAATMSGLSSSSGSGTKPLHGESADIAASVLIKLLIDMYMADKRAASPLTLSLLQGMLASPSPAIRTRAFDLLLNLAVHAHLLEPLQVEEHTGALAGPGAPGLGRGVGPSPLGLPPRKRLLSAVASPPLPPSGMPRELPMSGLLRDHTSGNLMGPGAVYPVQQLAGGTGKGSDASEWSSGSLAAGDVDAAAKTSAVFSREGIIRASDPSGRAGGVLDPYRVGPGKENHPGSTSRGYQPEHVSRKDTETDGVLAVSPRADGTAGEGGGVNGQGNQRDPGVPEGGGAEAVPDGRGGKGGGGSVDPLAGTAAFEALLLAILKEMLLFLVQMEEKDEVVWASALSCLLFLTCDRGLVLRERLSGVDVRVFKELLELSSQCRWSEDLRAQLVHMATNLLYTEDPTSSTSWGGVKSDLDLAKLQKLGGIGFICAEYESAKSAESRKNLFGVIFDYALESHKQDLETAEKPVPKEEDVRGVATALMLADASESFVLAFRQGCPRVADGLAQNIVAAMGRDITSGWLNGELLLEVTKRLDVLADSHSHVSSDFSALVYVTLASEGLAPYPPAQGSKEAAMLARASAHFEGGRIDASMGWATLRALLHSSRASDRENGRAWLVELLLAQAVHSSMVGGTSKQKKTPLRKQLAMLETLARGKWGGANAGLGGVNSGEPAAPEVSSAVRLLCGLLRTENPIVRQNFLMVLERLLMRSEWAGAGEGSEFAMGPSSGGSTTGVDGGEGQNKEASASTACGPMEKPSAILGLMNAALWQLVASGNKDIVNTLQMCEIILSQLCVKQEMDTSAQSSRTSWQGNKWKQSNDGNVSSLRTASMVWRTGPNTPTSAGGPNVKRGGGGVGSGRGQWHTRTAGHADSAGKEKQRGSRESMPGSVVTAFLNGKAIVPTKLLMTMPTALLCWPLMQLAPSPSPVSVEDGLLATVVGSQGGGGSEGGAGDMRAAMLLLLIGKCRESRAALEEVGGERFFRSLLEDPDARIAYFASTYLLKRMMTEQAEQYRNVLHRLVFKAQQSNNEKILENPYLQLRGLLQAWNEPQPQMFSSSQQVGT